MHIDIFQYVFVKFGMILINYNFNYYNFSEWVLFLPMPVEDCCDHFYSVIHIQI